VRPFLLVLSSPSGGGKTTIARRLLERRTDLGYSVSATTRAMRPGERHGTDYWFISRDEFATREARGEFLESATYNGERYGTLRAEVERVFAAGKHVVLDIEVEGARQIRQRFAGAVYVFVLPPSGAVLVERLRARRTEEPEALRRRMQHALDEFRALGEYDYAIVNDDLERAVTEVSAIIDGESRRVQRRNELEPLIDALCRDVQRAMDTL